MIKTALTGRKGNLMSIHELDAKVKDLRELRNFEAEIKAESMRRYGVPAEETEAALIRMMTSTEPEPDPVITSAPIGRRKKT